MLVSVLTQEMKHHRTWAYNECAEIILWRYFKCAEVYLVQLLRRLPLKVTQHNRPTRPSHLPVCEQEQHSFKLLICFKIRAFAI